MKRSVEDRHRELVDELEEKVKKNYTIIFRDVMVRNVFTGQVVGEIDLAGMVDGNLDLYEVKVTDRPQKARKQLLNLRRHLQNCGNVRLYYCCGKSGEIKEVA